MFRIIVLLIVILGMSIHAPAEARTCKRPTISLRGTPQSLAYQNCMADRLDYSRIKDDKQLKRFVRAGLLVPLRESRYVKMDGRLKGKYRYVRPETRRFVEQIGRRFYAEFGKPLWVNSAARTVEYQRRLTRNNPNAARGGKKDSRSSHLTGATIDFGKKKLTQRQLAWLRNRLLMNERVGRAETTEEFGQAVFHIMVLK